MSRSARSIRVFGLYLIVLGPTLVFVPNVLLAVFRIPPTDDVWVRVVGVVIFNMGIYYWLVARYEVKAVFRASLYTRSLVFVSFVAFAALDPARIGLMWFGVADLVGAMWTGLALRADGEDGADGADRAGGADGVDRTAGAPA